LRIQQRRTVAGSVLETRGHPATSVSRAICRHVSLHLLVPENQGYLSFSAIASQLTLPVEPPGTRPGREGAHAMSLCEFPMVFPADGAPLVGRIYRNVDQLVTPQAAVVITGSWLTVKEQMARTYALRLAEQGITAFTFDFSGFGQSGGAP